MRLLPAFVMRPLRWVSPERVGSTKARRPPRPRARARRAGPPRRQAPPLQDYGRMLQKFRPFVEQEGLLPIQEEAEEAQLTIEE